MADEAAVERDEVSQVITTLLTAPGRAAVRASREQRAIWIEWLRDVQGLLEGEEDPEIRKSIVRQHMRLAPVWQASVQVSLGITMRVASIERREAGMTLGLGVGLLQSSGSFGFMSETSAESVLQARAQYALSNQGEVTLPAYLESLGVDVAGAEDVTAALSKLEGAAP